LFCKEFICSLSIQQGMNSEGEHALRRSDSCDETLVRIAVVESPGFLRDSFAAVAEDHRQVHRPIHIYMYVLAPPHDPRGGSGAHSGGSIVWVGEPTGLK
jgi:hypothetical protein